MKRSEIKTGSTYLGGGATGRPHQRYVNSIDERPAYSSDTHIVTYSRLYKNGWSGGFNCTLGYFAAWAKEVVLPIHPVLGRRYRDDIGRQITVIEPVADNAGNVLIEVEDYRGNSRRITWPMQRWYSSIVEELA